MFKENGCMGLVGLVYDRECNEISAQCIEEGYPGRGSNYDLRCESLWDEEFRDLYDEAADHR